MTTEPTLCLRCARLDLRKHPKHSELGFGYCDLHKPIASYVSVKFDRKCDAFRPAEKETIEKRVEWVKGRWP